MYIVQYGFDNSHMCEFESFNLYRDAKKFYEGLNIKFQSKTCQKLIFNKNGVVVDREYKLFKFQPGTDNTLILERMSQL